MIEARLTISGTILKDLDLLDKKVVNAVKRGIRRTAEEGVELMYAQMNAYGWNAPKTTGNLRALTGYVMQGGGYQNLRNYAMTKVAKTGKSKKIRGGMAHSYEKASIPQPPDNPFSAIFFSLAYYAPYQEYGTIKNAPHPFFWYNIGKAWIGVSTNIQTELLALGL